MADKKITDLQLRSSVTDDLNFPSDDSTQSYRVTALQILNYILATGKVPLTALDAAIFNGLTAVTPLVDDYVTLVDTSDSNKTKKALVSALRPKLGFQIVGTGTSWTSPADITSATVFKFTLLGGGGGGGGAKGAWAGAGGGGGGARTIVYTSGLTASTAYTIAIGAGGSSGSNTGGNGGDGGATTLTIGATTYTANGGGGGAGSTNTGSVNYSLGGGGGTQTSNGDLIESGNNGGTGICYGANIPLGGFGGMSPLGVGALGGTALGSGGNTPGGFGAGGSGAASGSTTGYTGGAGVHGLIIVEWVA